MYKEYLKRIWLRQSKVEPQKKMLWEIGLREIFEEKKIKNLFTLLHFTICFEFSGQVLLVIISIYTNILMIGC